MTFEEKDTAILKFERRLRAFIENYIDDGHPTSDEIRQCEENGEHICVKYDTLEISVMQEKDLPPAEYYHYQSERFEGYCCIDILRCTKCGINGSKRYVDARDTEDYSCACINKYISIHGVKDVTELPEFCRKTQQEREAEAEAHRRWEEEKERERLEKERVRAEHALKKDETVLALVIPDIHGRTFWKDAVAKYPHVPVIFLGDYLDPYWNYIEKIGTEDALRNFKEILEYRHQQGIRVTLLLGNHDLHYFTPDFDCSRKDMENAEEIRSLFEADLSLFDIAGCMETDGPDVIYSHAGIVSEWMSLRFPDIDRVNYKSAVEVLNSMLHDPGTSSDFIKALVADAPYQRGGSCEHGSPVWAHLSEFRNHSQNGVYQIFGHTQQEEDPIYGDGYCCTDCRRAFLLTKGGRIAEFSI